MLTASELNSRLPYLFGSEIEELQELGRNLPENGLVVMLGVGPGLMALALLEGAGNKPFTFRGVDNSNFTAIDHLAMADCAGRLLVFNDDSAYHANAYVDNSVDLLLVDANHTYTGVMRDINAWWSRVKSGGMILFHDYIPQAGDDPDNGVKQAVHEFFDPKTLMESRQFGSSILVKKS